MRCRQHPVAIKGDIKDMFLIVQLREEDRDEHRFLWRGKDRDGPSQEYVMESLIFGMSLRSNIDTIITKYLDKEQFF